MASDEEVFDGALWDPASATAGPRRSTFTPPPGADQATPETPAAEVAPGIPTDAEHDDDELANALAADLGRLAPPSAPDRALWATEPPPAATPVAPTPEPVAAPEPVAPSVAPPVAESEPAPVREPAPIRESVAQPEPPSAPEPTAQPIVEPAAPAWASLPAPDPAQAAPTPQRPVRRSLPDSELESILEQAQAEGTLGALDQLEAQMQLREVEVREFRAWEATMLAMGTPDAVEAVEAARTEFAGVLPRSTPARHADAPVSVEPPAPEPAPAEPVAAEPVAEPTVGGPPVPEPVLVEPVVADPVSAEPMMAEPMVAEPAVAEPTVADPPVVEPVIVEPSVSPMAVPDPTLAEPTLADPTPAGANLAESAVAEPTVAEFEPFVAEPTVAPIEETPEPAVWAPPVSWQPPFIDAPAPTGAPVADAPPAPAAHPVTEPVPVLPSWDIPAPSESWMPEIAPEPVAAPAPEPDLEPEPDPEPLPDPELRFEPPALIEPPPFGAPPASPALEEVVEATLVDDEPMDDEPIEAAPLDLSIAPEEPSLPVAPPADFSFDDLLTGSATAEILDEEVPFRSEPTPASPAEAIFVEPLPVTADEGVPIDTGSIPVIDQAFVEEELDDDVDETDRVGGPGVTGPIVITAAGVATSPVMVAPPSGPIPTVRIPDDEVVLIDNEPVRQRVFSIEGSGLEPTPVEHRIGRAARLFWLWFAANSTILSLGLGAVVFTVGMSLRQAIVAVLAGVALSFFPLGLTTLAGKRSGQPTMVVSRATFGVVGNVIPALIALLTRIFWGAVLLWLVGSSVAIVLVGGAISGPFGERQLVLIAIGATVIIAVFIAFAGYPMIARLQLILSILSLALIIGLIVMTWQLIDLGAALSTPDGSWLLTITGAVLVFSFVGLVWANSGADLARYQRVSSSGAGSMLWATFGATVPTFLLIGYGVLLAASNPDLARGFVLSPLDTLAGLLPLWYPIPLIAATVLSLLSGIIITLYSGGFALKALGVNVSRSWSVVMIAVPLTGLAMIFAFGITEGLTDLFRDAATTLAVPTAAWAGIFAAEMMIRNRRFESESLVRRGGVYADVRWGNLLGLLIITGIGFGLTSATVSWLSWQGYFFTLLGVPLDGDLGGTDLGVLVALGLGILLPIIAGIPAIRRQEAARV
jgi:purine-cytosine permease-like protein